MRLYKFKAGQVYYINIIIMKSDFFYQIYTFLMLNDPASEPKVILAFATSYRARSDYTYMQYHTKHSILLAGQI